MKRTAAAAVSLGLIALVPSPAAAAVVSHVIVDGLAARVLTVSDAEDATAVIRSVYEHYNTGDYADQDKKSFTPELYKTFMDVQDGAGDDVELAIDFDVFLNAQDEDKVVIEDLAFQPAGPADGTVTARLTLFGETSTFVFTMKKTGKGWRIDDIAWSGSQETFRQLLAMHAAEQKAR